MSKAPVRGSSKVSGEVQHYSLANGADRQIEGSHPSVVQRLPGHTRTDVISADSHLS